jgi:diacylglycerol kinase
VEPNRSGQRWNIVRSARDAYSGAWRALRRTRSLQLGLAASVAAIVVGRLLGLSLVELLLIVLAATLLMAVEIMNTAIELLCDFVHAAPHPAIGRIKDIAAGATACCEVGAAVVLVVLYGDRIWHLLGH